MDRNATADEPKRSLLSRVCGWAGQKPDQPASEATVLQAEREQILAASERSTSEGGFAALALSGGGIRSATFNLGVLQGLAQRGLLARLDYLSTASGGGYIGSWLSALTKHTIDIEAAENKLDPRTAAARGIEAVEKELDPRTAAPRDGKEPDSVTWLRRFSNYLTPRTGFLSTDTLAGVATYVRNLLLTQAVLVCAFSVVLVAPRLIPWVSHFSLFQCPVPAMIALFVPALFINLNLAQGLVRKDRRAPFFARQKYVLWLIVLPLILAAWLIGILLLRPLPAGHSDNGAVFLERTTLAFGAVWLVAWGLVELWAAGKGMGTFNERWGPGRRMDTFKGRWPIPVGLMAALAVGVTLLALLHRLVRCYLGASNPDRRAHPFTGFDPEDDVKLTDLPPRPFHIVNTAINLTKVNNLAWQERKAGSFVFTRLYCGYSLPAGGSGEAARDSYRRTSDYLSKSNPKGRILLGQALAISGAAASPNQGYHSSTAVAFLLTVFNVRLGWWMQNPAQPGAWGKPGPRFGLWYLLSEVFGLADEDTRYVYLSDGGHFDNLGIYELVRRRCRFIIAVDAGMDQRFGFEDLGNAVRKCQVDFGVRIDIDTRASIPVPGTGKSLYHCGVGRIHYEDADPKAVSGFLLYIKPSLTGNEPVDIMQYASVHPEFPHQSTTDQWFDESQFEAYRKLGYYTTTTVLEKSAVEPQQDVYLDLNLDEEWQHPDNRGWMNLFKHFSWAGMLRATYAIVRSNFGARFQRFCNVHLALPEGVIEIEGMERNVGTGAGLKAWSDQREKEGRVNFVEAALIYAFENPAPPAQPAAAARFDKLHTIKLVVAGTRRGQDAPADLKAKPELSFPVGVALTQGNVIVFFRIQDHLRNMGLGRGALNALYQMGYVTLDIDESSPDAKRIIYLFASIKGRR